MDRLTPPTAPPAAARTTVGHPVDVASGTVFTAWHDFEFQGFIHFVWRRFFSTKNTALTPLGRGWTTAFFMTLREDLEGFGLVDEDGIEVEFPPLDDRGVAVNFSSQMELRRFNGGYRVYNWHHREYYLFAPAGEAGRFRIAAIQDLPGNSLRIAYDEAGRFAAVDQAGQRTVAAVYNPANLIGRLILRTDGREALLVEYAYDEAGRLIRATDALGNAIHYSYDGLDRLISETNRLGGTFRFEYDNDGRCVRCWGDGGYMERRLEYLTAARLTRVANSLGHVTEYQYNESGLVTLEKWPRGGVTATQYDELGRVTMIGFPNGGAVGYTYDENGNRDSYTDESGSAVRVFFNELHLPVRALDADGFEWRLEHDARGNLLSVINPLGQRWGLEREEHGLASASLYPGGRRIERMFGPLLAWQESRDQLSFLERREYDERGNEIRSFDAEGLVYEKAYDAIDRHVEVRYSDGKVIGCRWDAGGNLVERTWPGGITDYWQYDRFGHVTAHIHPDGRDATSLKYDTEAKLVGVTDPLGRRLTLEYDEDGGLVRQTFFDGRVETYERDLASLVVKIHKADGTAIEQKHDACARVVERICSDGTFTRLAFGNRSGLIRAETKDAIVEFERDAANRVVAEVQNGQRLELTVDADHNPVSRRIAGLLDEGTHVEFDIRGRPRRFRAGAQVLEDIEWDPLDRMAVRRLMGGAVERRTWGSDRRLLQQEVASRAEGVLARRRFGYDATGNLARLDDVRRGSSEFEYDLLNRLTRVGRSGGPGEWYRYDPLGNIVESHVGVRTVDPQGHTASANGVALTYDSNGRVTQLRGPSGVTTLAYDAEDQLVEVTDPRGRRTRYGYDAMGRRAWKQVGDRRIDFVWSLFDLTAEIENGSVTRQYLSYLFTPHAQWADGSWYSVVCDHRSMPHETIARDGALAWTARLDSFGAVLEDSGAAACPMRFRGQYHDSESGLYYNIHRVYFAGLGIYTTPDPIGIQGGVNPYSFPNNPVMWDDPFGLKCGSCVTGANGQRQLAPGQGNKGKGRFGESMMDDHMRAQGYVPIHAANRPQGIDGVYYHPQTGQYVIAESKFGSSQLGNTHDSRQMTNTWINGTSSPSTGGQTRLEHALQGSGHTSTQVQAAGASKILVHTDAAGNITTTPIGTYP
jgi:RHS repeat-associated protein